jgi:GNAT superfamily N-acetyltransferase
MVIKRLKESDLPFLLEVRNDDRTRHYLEDNRKFTLDECKEWFKGLELFWYVIWDNGQRKGYVRLSRKLGKLYIGIDIHPDQRRKGYARRTFEMFLKTAKIFHISLYLWVFEKNHAYEFYKRLGFRDLDWKILRGRIYRNMVYES